MVTTPTTGADGYQDLSAIRDRIDYTGGDFFSDNEQLRFDQLLVRLEEESRGIFETLWGDESVLEETGRVDEFRTTDDAAIPLVYPINDVSKVEYKAVNAADYKELDTDRYDFTEHRLVLSERPTTNALRVERFSGNPLERFATRATWGDLAAKLRVTYDRGFSGGAPADIKSVQIAMIQNALRHRKQQQTMSAASPEEMAQSAEMDEFLTDEIRNRVADVTKPGLATQSF